MVAFNLQFHSNIPGRPFGQTTTWSRPATSAGTCGTSPPPLMGDVAGLGFTGSGMPSGCHFYNSELFFYIWTWRSWRVWKLNAAYYPETLVETADLDPKKNHLVCCQPHGILCFGAVVREYFFSLTDPNLTTHKDAFGARIHVDCRPFFQAYWPGYVPFRLVKHVHQLLFCVSPREHSCSLSSGSAFFKLVGWRRRRRALLWKLSWASQVAARLQSWWWAASQRWWWHPSLTRSSFTWARGKDW